MAIEFGNSRYVKCQRCGRPHNATRLCECMRAFLRGVPTNQERRDYFDSAGTSTASQVGKGPTRLDVALSWAGYAALMGLAGVGLVVAGIGWVAGRVRR